MAKRFHNEGKTHGEHAGEPHPAGKTGKQHRGVLPPHRAIFFQEKIAAQQGAGNLKNQAMGRGLAEPAYHPVDKQYRQAQRD